MSLATTYCRAALGIDAPLVTVETHLANGLPAFNIVGLPEKAVQESRDRVRSALLNSGFEFPARRITINLAPADIPKQGARFDLAIDWGWFEFLTKPNPPWSEIKRYVRLVMMRRISPWRKWERALNIIRHGLHKRG